jgi:uncharacterized phage-like protein YoqJ
MNIIIEETACFTGHRPDKLGGYAEFNNSTTKKIYKKLIERIIYLIETLNINTFISGGALGVDTIAFFAVNEVKQKYYPNIKNILAVPYEDQNLIWKSEEDLDRYEIIKKLADEIIYVDELPNYKLNGFPIKRYHIDKLQKRNEFMVDCSSIIISVWDGSSGGTKNCIKYANKKNKLILLILTK